MTFHGKPSPIALFVFNRYDHVVRSIEALKKNDLAQLSDLYVFSDEAKAEHQRPAVQAVRQLIQELQGFKSVHLICRPTNWGLSKSIVDGVTEVIDLHGKVIVLEDDLVTAPYFLRFMNEALEFYANEFKIAAIHGYTYPVVSYQKIQENFFLRGADCWGWATWKRAWQNFQPNGQILLDEIHRKNLRSAFDLENSYNYTEMLEDQIAGRNQSWAIRWQASAFLKEMLSLYPRRSLVQNIGFDQSGEHCAESDFYDVDLFQEPIPIHPIPVVENQAYRKQLIQFYSRRKQSWKAKLPYSLRRVLRKIKYGLPTTHTMEKKI